MCGYMDQSYLLLCAHLLWSTLIPQKMIPHLLCAWFWNGALGSLQHLWYCAITLKCDMGILLTDVTHGVCDPKELRATTRCGNILYLGSGLSNTRLFAGRPRHQRGSQELASPRSGLPIQPTPGKIRVRKTMKRQRRRRGVPKTEVGSVTQVPEYALNRLLMRSPWRRLKMSARTYRELEVRPRRHQVEELHDHAPVLLLVHVFTFLIHIKSCSRTHRPVAMALESSILNFLIMYLVYLA
jgi:hypothetical protein